MLHGACSADGLSSQLLNESRRGLVIYRRELPSLVAAAYAVTPVSVLELRERTLDSTDSAPPMEPPVKEAGAEADAAEVPRDMVQFWPFSCTCRITRLD